jgi:2-oxoglutarate ferredoxin oxidoreductase subunit delta
LLTILQFVLHLVYRQVFSFGKRSFEAAGLRQAFSARLFFILPSVTATSNRAVMSKKKGQAKVTIYPDWCKGCGICAAFCPAGVFELQADGKSHVVREEECVNCGFCELHCPDFAVSVTPKEGSRRKSDAADPRSARSGRTAATDSDPKENVGTPNREEEDGHEKA